jgi:hypothetical protein
MMLLVAKGLHWIVDRDWRAKPLIRFQLWCGRKARSINRELMISSLNRRHR